MHDSETMVTTQSTRTPPMPNVASRRHPKAQLTPVRKLTRAHLAVERRPAAVEEARAALAAVAAELSTQLGGELALEARLLDAVVHPLVHLAAGAHFVVLELGALGTTAVVELDAAALGLLLERSAGSAPSAGPHALTRVEEAALGWVLLSSLHALRSTALAPRFAPRLVGVFAERSAVHGRLDAGQRHVALELTVRAGGRSGAARLIVPAAALEAALGGLAEDLAGDVAEQVLAATLPATCFVGPTVLDRETVDALQPGDVVLFQGVTTTGAGVTGRARLLTATFELRGHLSADGFTLTGASSSALPRESAMSENDSSLPVEVEVELTRVRLPLKELSTLKPGGLLPLHVTGAQTVTLRVGDRAVARAELVEIDGELGARVVELL